jgi:hypothetical protein
MGYLGKERRIHRIFVTRNSEYHVRRNVCVGVRDRRSGEWLSGGRDLITSPVLNVERPPREVVHHYPM